MKIFGVSRLHPGGNSRSVEPERGRCRKVPDGFLLDVKTKN
jgi:hypothetical protein